MAVPEFKHPNVATNEDLANAIEHLNAFASSLRVPISELETGARRREEYVSVELIAEWINKAAMSLADSIEVRGKHGDNG